MLIFLISDNLYALHFVFCLPAPAAPAAATYVRTPLSCSRHIWRDGIWSTSGK